MAPKPYGSEQGKPRKTGSIIYKERGILMASRENSKAPIKRNMARLDDIF